MSIRFSTSVVAVVLLGACGAAGDRSIAVDTTTATVPVVTTKAVTATTALLTSSVPVVPISAPPSSPSTPAETGVVAVGVASTPPTVPPPVTTGEPPPTEPPPTVPQQAPASPPRSSQFPLHFNSLQDFSQGAIVVTVQQRLNDWGYTNVAIDGRYGPATRDAVEQVQARAGLVVDGLVGPKTYAVLIGPVLMPD